MTITSKKNQFIPCYFLFLLLPGGLPGATGQQTGTDSTSVQPEVSKNMAVAFIAIISAFFVLGFFSFYARHCTEGRFGRRPGNFSAESRAAIMWRPARGLDSTFIATFPTFSYSAVKGLKIGKSSLECAVCINEFENSDTLRLIPNCSHVFHSVCIDSWLVSHSTCPVCRANLIPKPGDLDRNPRTDGTGTETERTEGQVSIVVAREEETAGANVRSPVQIANRSPSPWSIPGGWRFSGIFQRSNSTGHDRFTLRLPEEVRSRLVNSTLNRTRSWAELPSVQSSRRGYRSESGENGRDKKLLARNWSVPAPFAGRNPAKSPAPAEDDVGERSFERLRPKGCTEAD